MTLEDGTVVPLGYHGAHGMCRSCYQKSRDRALGGPRNRQLAASTHVEFVGTEPVIAAPAPIPEPAAQSEFVPRYGLTQQEALVVRYVQRRYEPVRGMEFLRMLGLFTSQEVYEDDLSAAIRAMNRR